jgi:ectoine hydroxylase-related dioxygenase (phytanoyl-CoA dioxygenase family)
VSEVRTEPLTPEEIGRFHEQGFLLPVRVLSDQQVEELREALDDHLSGRMQSETFELTDPIMAESDSAAIGAGTATAVREKTEAEVEKKPHSNPFLFNLWERDERFRNVAFNPVIAGMAAQLLGSSGVVLMEDGAIVKNPQIGKRLSWHQDYSYWPLATPAAVTAWIALDRVTLENGAMQVAAGSHKLGERLPVEFGDGRSFMHDERPGVEAIPADPTAGNEIVSYDLQPGECGFHDALLWHASAPNTSSNIRRAFVPRYVAAGTVWLGSKRFPYNFSDEEVGCEIGGPIGGPHFPVVPTAF